MSLPGLTYEETDRTREEADRAREEADRAREEETAAHRDAEVRIARKIAAREEAQARGAALEARLRAMNGASPESAEPPS